MSSEIAKKRGRPKKVISDPIESGITETTKKSTTRTKSTKAATAKSSTPKAKAATSAKASASKPAASSLPPQKAASKASSPPAKKPESETPPPPPPPAAAKQSPKSPVTPETSKILSKVRELSPKTIQAPEEAVKSSTLKPSPTNIDSEPVPTPQTNTPPPNPIATAPKPNISPPTPPPAPKATVPPTTKPHVPLAELNSAIVSNISTRAGARPNTAGSRALPPNYKSVARKITMGIVAAPILIVTSYVLYERLVLGEERKLLTKPSTPAEPEQDVK